MQALATFYEDLKILRDHSTPFSMLRVWDYMEIFVFYLVVNRKRRREIQGISKQSVYSNPSQRPRKDQGSKGSV